MLSIRFSILLIILFFFIVLLLSNGSDVKLAIAFIDFKVQQSVVIFCSTLFGGFIAIYILQILKSIGKIKNKIREYQGRSKTNAK